MRAETAHVHEAADPEEERRDEGDVVDGKRTRPSRAASTVKAMNRAAKFRDRFLAPPALAGLVRHRSRIRLENAAAPPTTRHFDRSASLPVERETSFHQDAEDLRDVVDDGGHVVLALLGGSRRRGAVRRR